MFIISVSDRKKFTAVTIKFVNSMTMISYHDNTYHNVMIEKKNILKLYDLNINIRVEYKRND